MNEIEKIKSAINRLEICSNVCDDCMTCAEHDTAIELAIKVLSEKLQQRWVSADEIDNLPKDKADVLVVIETPYKTRSTEILTFAKNGSDINEYEFENLTNIFYGIDSEYGYYAYNTTQIKYWKYLVVPQE